jgi:phosphatidylserine/phosphatidylglycerophosphate/cardiolipin synthase-like enzyme
LSKRAPRSRARQARVKPIAEATSDVAVIAAEPRNIGRRRSSRASVAQAMLDAAPAATRAIRPVVEEVPTSGVVASASLACVARRMRDTPLADVARRIRSPAARARTASSLDEVARAIRAPVDEAPSPTDRNTPASATGSLADVARRIRRPAARARTPSSLDEVARAIRAPAVDEPTSVVDGITPARAIAMQLVSGRAHYERVIAAIREAHTSVWIATANVKELMVEDGRARPGRRRSMRRSTYVSILAILDDLASRGVELRLLHAELPSGPFREELANHPRLVAGGLALRRCPRVHLKTVIVDGTLMYLGSANWTGAGLGAKGSGRRNFELGMLTDDALALDQVQSLYDHLWNGGECAACKLRDECPGPLAELVTPPALPAVSKIRRRQRPRLL